uniref:Uncharacterized protein n=1 Tax=Arundo donax TaxID=35708 RepID=A0A0A8YNE5_ARUDO
MLIATVHIVVGKAYFLVSS